MANQTFGTVEEYVTQCSPQVQEQLRQVRCAIRETCPEAEETIKWRMPTYVYKGTNLIHFAAHAKHIGLYAGEAGTTWLSKQAPQYRATKGALQLPCDQPVPLDLIAAVVRFNMEKIDAGTMQ